MLAPAPGERPSTLAGVPSAEVAFRPKLKADSIAGGAILFTTMLLGQTKSVKEISSVAGVSEGTIKLVYKHYLAAKDVLVNKEWIESGKADMNRLQAADGPKINGTSSTTASGRSTPVPGTPTPTATPSLTTSSTLSTSTTASSSASTVSTSTA